MQFSTLQAAEGIGGYYWRDQEAIAQGAPRNGFLYDGAPLTAGFKSIIQVSSTVVMTATMSDGRTLDGDCATVTFRELGLRDVDVPAWSAFLAPAGMPADRVEALYKQIAEAAKSPAYQNYLKISQAKLVLTPPQEFRKSLEAEVLRFKKELPELGIKGD